MKLRVKDMDIATGGVHVVIINQKDAQLLDLHHEDRLFVRKGRRTAIAIVDIAESSKAVPSGQIGVFEEVLDELMANNGDIVRIALGRKPRSLAFIKKKLDGKELSRSEIRQIVADITNDRLSDIELTSYVTANYAKGMSLREIVDLTKAMVQSGDKLRPKSRVVTDLHCIGGVPGNRTTTLVVPMLVAAGLTVPKTASRAITSPAGTADTMEVLCPVTMSKRKLEKILDEVGGFIVWGGSVNLAPSDEKIIRIEHPLSIDAEGQMLASIMAKKHSVGATHLLIDLPVGPGVKLKNKQEALRLKRLFDSIGKVLGIKVRVIITNGSQPIGNGIGPVLEARDCLWILQGDARGPSDLRHKSLRIAGELLEFTKKAPNGKGYAAASRLLRSGKAYDAMIAIIRAQGGAGPDPDKLRVGRYTRVIAAAKAGRVVKVDNVIIARVARVAGAPRDKEAGIFLHVRKGNTVKKGDPLFTIHANNKSKLENSSNEAWCSMEAVIVR